MTKLLILDLDETLVFSTTTPLERPPDVVVGEYLVYRRPGLEAFLQTVSKQFTLAVWTSSGLPYAQQVVRAAFSDRIPLAFLWARERCTARVDSGSRETYWVKDLKKVKRLGFPLEQILIVDDSPEKLERNYGNHLRVSPFEGSSDDQELALLARYLDLVKGAANVRVLEKRTWKAQLARSGDVPDVSHGGM